MYKQKFPKPLTSEELLQHKKWFLSLIHEYPYHSHLNLFTSSALRSYRKYLHLFNNETISDPFTFS